MMAEDERHIITFTATPSVMPALDGNGWHACVVTDFDGEKRQQIAAWFPVEVDAAAFADAWAAEEVARFKKTVETTLKHLRGAD